ncbi:MAG: c-type cytochrome [Candidatus Binatia bacterium]
MTHRFSPRTLALLPLAVTLAVASGCSDSGSGGGSGVPTPPNAAWESGVPLPAEPQHAGDPVRGRHALLHEGFMTCGIPYKLWGDTPVGRLISGSFGNSADAPRIPGREGINTDLPYFLTGFTTTDGVDVVNANCLMCHGGYANGEMVIGLGNANADFTRGAGGGIGTLPPAALDALGLTEGEKGQLQKMLQRGAVLGPETIMRTVGQNPAETIAVILMVHHDRDTLAWSDEPLTPLVIRDVDGSPIENPVVTSDPPPWWRVHKKNALFYNGMARGDHRGTMALATSVCVDNLDQAARVDAWFTDIQAFVQSVRAPVYPHTIDAALAADGKAIFEANCAPCHGTYAEDALDDEHDSYPSLLIPLDVIGTDPVVANAGVVHAPELVDWYNASFYGGITRMVPNDPFPGYMPPPLDGIWATAPYLHNGSVPTVELVLNSKARPSVWRRVDFDSRNLDEEALGWPFVALDVRQADLPADEQKFVYDTGYWSQSNAGHTFGDHLTDAQRRAVIEYLKTL